MLSLLAVSIESAHINQSTGETPYLFILFSILFLIRLYLFLSLRAIPCWSISPQSNSNEIPLRQGILKLEKEFLEADAPSISSFHLISDPLSRSRSLFTPRLKASLFRNTSPPSIK